MPCVKPFLMKKTQAQCAKILINRHESLPLIKPEWLIWIRLACIAVDAALREGATVLDDEQMLFAPETGEGIGISHGVHPGSAGCQPVGVLRSSRRRLAAPHGVRGSRRTSRRDASDPVISVDSFDSYRRNRQISIDIEGVDCSCCSSWEPRRREASVAQASSLSAARNNSIGTIEPHRRHAVRRQHPTTHAREDAPARPQ